MLDITNSLSGPSIGHIPEILDIILEYLDQSTVRHSASCVNKMWNAACRPYIQTVTKWNVFQSEDQLLAHQKRVQKQASILHVFQPEEFDTSGGATYRHGQFQDTMELLVATLKGLSAKEQQRYTGLILQDINNGWNFLTLLPFLPHLRHLRIENCHHLIVAMDTILHACPLLTHLHVTSFPTMDGYGTNSISFTQLSVPPPENIQLQSLVLDGMILSVDPLLSILSKCKLLTELKLISMQQRRFGHHQPYSEYRRIQLFSQLREACPDVRSFHFSLQDSKMTQFTYKNIEEFFPDLEAWSCSKVDADQRMFATLNNYHHLTTLEIVSGFQSAAIPLHQYLGKAPNLVHLRAPDVFIDIEDLQLHLVAEQTTIGALWACNRLETLHISIQDRFVDNNSTRQQLFSRAMFAYLADVCPKLIDVYITYATLTLEMESGFCLLSKLKNLRSLQLKIARPERVTEQDLWWTSASSTAQHKRWSLSMQKPKVGALLAKMRVSKEARSPIPYLFGGCSTEEEAQKRGKACGQVFFDIDRVIREYHLSTTVDLLESMLKSKENDGAHCWPNLQIWSLIKSKQKPTPVQVDLIDKLRPGIRCQRSIYCDLTE